MTRLALLLAGLLLLTPPARADVNAFGTDSLAQIEARRAGGDFVLVLWSVDCPPCLKELALLGRLTDARARQRLVLVATDEPERHAEAEALRKRFGLDDLEHWAFDATEPERLRQHIDPAWFGELPRSYFYAAGQPRQARSGLLDAATLGRWLGTAIPGAKHD
ncbi:MAG: TlpA family protein disulfide reductase [Proteobacteria bacterium]|nr:MAG: TlpA family protein disulfide reductase [Pseudomonadota bacterium]